MDNDADWFRALYDRCYPDVVRYGLRRLDGLAAAEELAQEVFLIAWRRRREVPDVDLPWLYGVGRRLLANHWRSARAAPAVTELVEAPDLDRHDGIARLVDVRAALNRLSGDDREILRLVGWEQLSLAEAAIVLGCTAATARVRLFRARRRLSERLNLVGGAR